MARNHKFSFPLPRRSRPKASDRDRDDARSQPSTAPVPDWPSSTSKAHRILGTADPLCRANYSQTHIPSSSAYTSVAASEASYGSHADDRSVAEGSVYGKRPGMAKRSSSNLLGRSFTNEGGRGSENSSITQRLRLQTSTSTMRSHYDAKNSPLSISQQTSDSAVRDRALRRGHPPVLSDHGYDDDYQPSPVSPTMTKDAAKKDQRKNKGKPARLDLSKLFPKPKTGDTQDYGRPMLSPEKMVNSPTAMSMASDYFPRPMTREPTPKIGESVPIKSATRHRSQVAPSPTSPRRKIDRDEYDNAKVHVRRPPKGVQHWFDALDEESDGTTDEAGVPLHAPRAVRLNGVSKVPLRKTSLDQLLRHAGLTQSEPRSKQRTPQSKHDSFAHEDIVDVGRLTSPSQYSVNTHNSVTSNRTKESAWSKSNLQDASVLSFSSSEDEEVDQPKARRYPVRKSLDLVADAGEIIVGQAQAFDIRPHLRRPSAGVMSTRSTTSTSAATIEVMYTPEVPFIPYQYQSQYQNQYQNHYPRNSVHSSSKRSSHLRQPSVIHEDDDARPRTAVNRPLSPSTHSIQSTRTSTSEPQAQSNGSRKMMAVTAEEEALLELMRKKRAELQKNGSSPQAAKSITPSQRLRTPSESSREPHRASAFRALEGNESPVLAPAAPKAPSTCSTFSPSPLLLPSRGRPERSHSKDVTSQFRDSSTSATSDTGSDRHASPATRGRLPHYLPTPAEFSPLEPFASYSPTPTASVTSPTDPEASRPSSPITPGPSRGGSDVIVKVACSDTSADADEVAILDNGVIDAQPSDSVKSDSSHELNGSVGRPRRRTASSGADVAFPAPPTGVGATRALTPFTEAQSSSSSISNEIIFPKVPVSRKNSRRVDELVSSSPVTSATARVRQSSVNSTASRNSSYSTSSLVPGMASGMERRSSKLGSKSRGSSVASSRRSGRDSSTKRKNSVSDDILAAWNSLGGTY
ncbi:hypothetical protein NX059_007796 [Plenodomus lindquistii]|nr:hypothetical protein NX059_007796 [Plenodomus lindquistii]